MVTRDYHSTKKPNPPPTKRSKMSKEDQLLGPVREKRPLNDIRNYAVDPKQRRREKDLARKRAARAKSPIKRKPRGLIIRRNMSKIRDTERLTSNMTLVYVISE